MARSGQVVPRLDQGRELALPRWGGNQPVHGATQASSEEQGFRLVSPLCHGVSCLWGLSQMEDESVVATVGGSPGALAAAVMLIGSAELLRHRTG